MPRRALTCLLLFLLTGCTAPAPARTPAAPPAPLPFTLWAEAVQDPGMRLVARDPATLAERPEQPPLPFGLHFAHAFSADGRTLAAILWPRGTDNQDGVLHLIDLHAWSDQATPVRVDDWVMGLTFAPDGQSLYWLQPGAHDPAHGIPVDWVLWRYAAGKAKAEALTHLPKGFQPDSARLLPAGRHLAVYGVPTDAEYLSTDGSHVLSLELPGGRLAWDLRLADVRAGQRLNTEGDVNRTYDGPGLAWDLPASLLYVVGAGGDRVTVVDLAKGRVRQAAEVRPRAGLLERLGLQRRAEAKMMPGTGRQAVLSPDGRRLYVTGRLDTVSRLAANDWRWQSQPLGLQVIDTADLQETGRGDLPVSAPALSGDGRHLLLWNDADSLAEDRQRPGLYLLDAGSLEVAAHLLAGSDVFFVGFSPDGRLAYVIENDPRATFGRLHAVDLAAGQIAGTRTLGPGGVVYLPPQP